MSAVEFMSFCRRTFASSFLAELIVMMVNEIRVSTMDTILSITMSLMGLYTLSESAYEILYHSPLMGQEYTV